jgi:hypothetical protein
MPDLQYDVRFPGGLDRMSAVLPARRRAGSNQPMIRAPAGAAVSPTFFTKMDTHETLNLQTRCGFRLYLHLNSCPARPDQEWKTPFGS